MKKWKASPHWLLSIADNAPVLMWRADKTMSRDWVNRAWREFTGRRMDQDHGFGWAEALHPEDREAGIESYRQAGARGAPFALTYRLRRADGAFRRFRDNVSPTTDDSGSLTGFVGACTDVDDILNANDALSLAARDRAEAVAQRDHLLREVQHRVRNNLQLILSIIDLQARADPASRLALGLVAGRVRSIAKAQALLLDPTGTAQINLTEYLPSLAKNAAGGPPVSFEGPADGVMMPLSEAVPLGLMINEILSLFAGRGNESALHIRLSSDSNAAFIEIERDDGATPDGGGIQDQGPWNLIQRLSIQAGARLEQQDASPGKFVVRIGQPS